MASEDKKDFNAMLNDSKQSGADFTEPITAGIFVSIVAWASFQRKDDKTPYWRTLKANGELNAKCPVFFIRNYWRLR